MFYPRSDNESMASTTTFIEKVVSTNRGGSGNTSRNGSRKKVLLFTNSEYGQANVILAVAYELLLLGEYEVHIASFKSLRSRINDLNRSISKSVLPAIFHTVVGASAMEALIAKNEFIGPYPPGIKGAIATYKVTIPALATIWEGPEYMTGYKSCLRILCSVNPNVVVLEPFMCQGIEACETLSYKNVILSPDPFQEVFRKQQPLFKQLLRIPAYVFHIQAGIKQGLTTIGCHLPFPTPYLYH
jgi:hypothetical protein